MNFRHLIAVSAMSIALIAPSIASAKSVRVYTQKIDAKQICGTTFAKYRCSTTLQHMNLSQTDIALQLLAPGSPNYSQVLGRSYTGVTGTAVSLSPCGGINDADYAIPSAATTFDYKKKASNEFGASTSIDVKSALTAAGVPSTELDNLQAQFEATYGRKAKAEYTLKGRYFRRELKTSVLDQIRGVAPATSKLQQCGDALRKSWDVKLIYSIAKVKAKHSGADIAGLTLSVKSRIETSLSTAMDQEWRVISWDFIRLGTRPA
jgi:hypothetical protein